MQLQFYILITVGRSTAVAVLHIDQNWQELSLSAMHYFFRLNTAGIAVVVIVGKS